MYKQPYVLYMSCSKNSLSQRPFERPRKNGHRDTLGGESVNLLAQLRVQAEPMTRATAFHD